MFRPLYESVGPFIEIYLFVSIAHWREIACVEVKNSSNGILDIKITSYDFKFRPAKSDVVICHFK